MSLKKKLGMGILSGAFGLALIGGGSWAAFNDVETINNSFAAGTLDLSKGTATEVFNVSNLKPGDYFTKTLTLSNAGSLDINDIYLTSGGVSGWTDMNILGMGTDGVNTQAQFLSQFDVVISKGATPVYGTGSAGGAKTLQDLASLSLTGAEITNTNPLTVGMAPGASQAYTFKVTFKEDPAKLPSGLYVQNKYQGEGATIQFVFEATQMPGEER